MLSAFSDANVEYLVVGAFALAYHGLPRATGDLDLWVRPSEDNARRVMAALVSFGAPTGGISPSDLEQPDMVFQFGMAPRRIDLLTGIDGIDFGEAWEDRCVLEQEGLLIPVISRAHFVRNKRAVGRPRDISDAEWLEGKP